MADGSTVAADAYRLQKRNSYRCIQTSVCGITEMQMEPRMWRGIVLHWKYHRQTGRERQEYKRKFRMTGNSYGG